MRRLPPLAAVRVFEAAGRHENFTVAGAELGMTQAAVSHQIRVLEERIGVPLFRRERRRVILTDAGRRALGQVTGGLDAIAAAFDGLRAEDEGVLTVSTFTSFASTWLAWKLGAFQMAHPDVAVRMLTSDALADFASGEVDVAVRYGRGGWQGLVAERLFQFDFTPMCSPAFLERHGGAAEPAALLDLPVISPHDTWWATWFAEAGVAIPERGLRRGVRLDSQAHEGHAALGGQGVALLTPLLWRHDVAAGRLVRPFAQVSTQGEGVWLVYPEHRRHAPKVVRFREWIVAELAADRASLA